MQIVDKSANLSHDLKLSDETDGGFILFEILSERHGSAFGNSLLWVVGTEIVLHDVGVLLVKVGEKLNFVFDG